MAAPSGTPTPALGLWRHCGGGSLPFPVARSPCSAEAGRTAPSRPRRARPCSAPRSGSREGWPQKAPPPAPGAASGPPRCRTCGSRTPRRPRRWSRSRGWRGEGSGRAPESPPQRRCSGPLERRGGQGARGVSQPAAALGGSVRVAERQAALDVPSGCPDQGLPQERRLGGGAAPSRREGRRGQRRAEPPGLLTTVGIIPWGPRLFRGRGLVGPLPGGAIRLDPATEGILCVVEVALGKDLCG